LFKPQKNAVGKYQTPGNTRNTKRHMKQSSTEKQKDSIDFHVVGVKRLATRERAKTS